MRNQDQPALAFVKNFDINKVNKYSLYLLKNETLNDLFIRLCRNNTILRNFEWYLSTPIQFFYYFNPEDLNMDNLPLKHVVPKHVLWFCMRKILETSDINKIVFERNDNIDDRAEVRKQQYTDYIDDAFDMIESEFKEKLEISDIRYASVNLSHIVGNDVKKQISEIVAELECEVRDMHLYIYTEEESMSFFSDEEDSDEENEEYY
jgi:hypothetical protein